MSVTDAVTAVGWIGAGAGAAAYMLVTRGRWNAASARYQTANLTGAGLMGGVAAFNGIWPAFAANLVWVVIGGHALWAIGAKRRDDRLVAQTADALRAQWTEPVQVDAATLAADPTCGEPVGALAPEGPVPSAPQPSDDDIWQALLEPSDDVVVEADRTLMMSIDEIAELQVRRRRVAA